MLDKLGISGVVGLLIALFGLGIVVWKAPIVAAGLILILLGFALAVRSVAKSLMGMFGF